MEVFVYNSASPRESLEDFNKRLGSYCLANAVVSVNAQVAQTQLVISVGLADDLNLEIQQPTLMPVVAEISAQDGTLEESLTALVETVRAHDREDDARIPTDVRITMREDDPRLGYATLMVITGAVAPEE